MGGGQDRGHGRLRLTALAASVSLAGGLVVAIATPGSASVSQRASVSRRAGHGSRASAVVAATGCHLGHGIQHVIEITLGNVHFFRDNPDVPSDLEMMPNLLHFIEGNGTLLSNNHTPLIAHTANDILTTATGLYPDRQGMAVANGYQTYNSRRHDRPGVLVRLLDRPDLRHRFDADPWPRHQPQHGVLAGPAGHHQPQAGAGHGHPGPVGAVHQGGL